MFPSPFGVLVFLITDELCNIIENTISVSVPVWGLGVFNNVLMIMIVIVATMFPSPFGVLVFLMLSLGDRMN